MGPLINPGVFNFCHSGGENNLLTPDLTQITVLLTANVGVLAVPSIARTPSTSLPVVAAIASGVSTAFCLGSIMICRILMRNFPRAKAMDVSPIVRYSTVLVS